jgi:hypothetical protein
MEKKSFGGVTLFRILVIVITLFEGWWSWNNQAYAESQKVTITNNKTEYEQGETITITIRNALDKSIWYLDYTRDLQVWGIEKFESNKWIDLKYTEEAFFLPIEKGGKELCYLIMRERPIGDVVELKPDSAFSFVWNQKICRDKTASEKPFEPLLIEKGLYRFSFSYGLSTKKAIKPEPWERVVDLAEVNIIYSNEFTIR